MAIQLIRVPDRGTVAWVAALIGLTTYALLIDAVHWRHFWVVAAIALATAVRQTRAGNPPHREPSAS